ncbi:MAG: right-handed parallel beta-helix repeat-containing protein, partial [Abditibacteriaceae bacterium]
ETNDTGAIECLDREKQDSGNIIQYNRILDVVGLKTTPEGKVLSPYYSWGIYLDDYSSGIIVRGNLVVRTDFGGICIHGGQNDVVENNIFVDGNTTQIYFSPIDDFMVNNRFTRNIVAFSAPDATLINPMNRPPAQALSAMDNNLYWHKAGADFFKTSELAAKGSKFTPLGSFDQWRAAGFDTHSLIADPLFVNAAEDDYRLLPNSPAFRLGFEKLPWEKMGMAGFERSFQPDAMQAYHP